MPSEFDEAMVSLALIYDPWFKATGSLTRPHLTSIIFNPVERMVEK
jgi:hypothetical protein